MAEWYSSYYYISALWASVKGLFQGNRHLWVIETKDKYHVRDKSSRKQVLSESFHSLAKVIWEWSAWAVYGQDVSTMKGPVSQ